MRVDVHREVDGVVGARGREGYAVGRAGPHLDREADPPVGPLDQGAQVAQRLQPGVAGHAVLHLPEHHGTPRGEHLVRYVAVAALAQCPGGEAVEPGDQARPGVAEPVDPAEDPVGQELVVEPGTCPRERLGLVEGAVVALGQQPVGVREPVHLEVLVGPDQLVEVGQRPVPAHRRLDRLQGEQRLDAQRHRGQDPESAEPEPGDLEDVRVLLGVRTEQVAVTGDQLQAGHLGAEGGLVTAGAVGPGGDRAGEGLLLDVAEVVQGQVEARESPVQLVQRGAGECGDCHRVVVHTDDAAQAVGAEQDPVGHGDVGEGVAGPGHLHGQVLVPRSHHCLDDVTGVVRSELLGRIGGGQTAPVAPRGHAAD